MNSRFILAALAAGCLLIGCSNSPAHRIAKCEKAGGTETACVAAEWDYEKATPLQHYDTAEFDRAAALQAAFNRDLNKTREKK